MNFVHIILSPKDCLNEKTMSHQCQNYYHIIFTLKQCPGIMQCLWVEFKCNKLCFHDINISRVPAKMAHTRHAYAWQIGHFWQDTFDIQYTNS